jgi:hypothetical protein
MKTDYRTIARLVAVAALVGVFAVSAGAGETNGDGTAKGKKAKAGKGKEAASDDKDSIVVNGVRRTVKDGVVIIDDKFIPKGPNLVPNGDFSKGGTFPDKWQPLPPHVEYIDAGGKNGKLVHFNVPRDVARSYGVHYLSDYIEIKPNSSYTYSFDCKKSGKVDLKVFLEGYIEHKGQRRKAYRSPVTPYFKTNGWERHGRREPFTPMHTSGRQIRWLRFSLYAYGGDAGEVWWDNIHMEELVISPEDDL